MTNAEAWFSESLRPRKPEGSLGRTAQDVHLDSHTAPELCEEVEEDMDLYTHNTVHEEDEEESEEDGEYSSSSSSALPVFPSTFMPGHGPRST